ncbi:CAP domain-containing protein [Nocardioides sp. SYSU DS0651]|uniref:CAP domain-containing protein n=1 Tax=Nocardioides sp. SYSU DS0651 TaxID=3415955 RepID=UPI003F4BB49E
MRSNRLAPALLLALLVCLATGLTAGAAMVPGAAPAAATPSPGRAAQLTVSLSSAMEDRVITLTNRKRAAHGCRPLRLHRDIRQAARRHSVVMAKARTLSHQLPDEPNLGIRLTRAGYTPWTLVAENLASGQTTPRQVVRAWMASPGHRRNILDCRLRHVGVGYVKYGDRVWWTQDFGRR